MLRHTPSQTIPDFLPAAQFSRMMADWYSYGIPHLKYLFWKQIAHVLYDALYKSFFVGWHNYTDSSMFLNLPFASRTCTLVEFICKHIQRVFGNQWPHIPLSDWPNPSQLTVSKSQSRQYYCGHWRRLNQDLTQRLCCSSFWIATTFIWRYLKKGKDILQLVYYIKTCKKYASCLSNNCHGVFLTEKWLL